MHQIIRNLLVFALVSTMAQFGMARWTSHFGADVSHDKQFHSSASHENRSRGSALPDANNNNNVIQAQEIRCVLPNIGCECPDCLGYFDAHANALPTIVIAPPEATESGAHESSTIASLVSINHTPPTPPPRS